MICFAHALINTLNIYLGPSIIQLKLMPGVSNHYFIIFKLFIQNSLLIQFLYFVMHYIEYMVMVNFLNCNHAFKFE